jgi:hypothetical protein
MRLLTAASILALAFVSQAALAQGQAARILAPGPVAAKIPSAEESAAMAEVQRKKAEAVQRTRDEKLKRTTRSICIGC